MAKQNAHYTVFIRLPFPRVDFQDPPLVAWDSIKDEALWKLIFSGSTPKKNIDWEAMSEKFDVSLPFLLQQAAWLSERHLQSMRRQVMRMGGAGVGSPISQEGEEAVGKRPEGGLGAGSGGVGMERQGSRGMSLCRPAVGQLLIVQQSRKNDRVVAGQRWRGRVVEACF